jgi:hypothetical protein
MVLEYSQVNMLKFKIPGKLNTEDFNCLKQIFHRIITSL